MSSGDEFRPPRPCLEPYDRLSADELKAMIDKVRAELAVEFEQHPDDYDAADVALIDDDWQIERFIRRKHTLDETLTMMKETLKWRRSNNMPNLKAEDFPEDFFKIGAMFDYESDRSGNSMIYMRTRRHRKMKLVEEWQKKFILYHVNKVDRVVGGKGLAIVFDCKGTGLSNLDMDILWFLLESMVKFFPAGLSYIVVYDLPWVLNSVWSMIRAWLPAEYKELIRFVSKEEMFSYVDKDKLPRYMGGTCARNMCLPPKECLPADHPKYNLARNEKELKQLAKHFQAFLLEAEEEEKKYYGSVVA